MSQQSSSNPKDLSGTPAKNGGNEPADKGFAALKDGLVKDSGQLTGGLKDLATGVASDAKQAVEGQLDSQKGRVVEGLDGVAEALRRVSTSGNKDEGTSIAPTLVPYIEEAADRVERASAYFDQKSLGEVARDVEDFARREPALFLGGAFALGLLGGRFLKASQPAGASHGSSYGQSRGRSRNRQSAAQRGDRLTSGSQGRTQGRNGNHNESGNGDGQNQYGNGNDTSRFSSGNTNDPSRYGKGNDQNQSGKSNDQSQYGNSGQNQSGNGNAPSQRNDVRSTQQDATRGASDDKSKPAAARDGQAERGTTDGRSKPVGA